VCDGGAGLHPQGGAEGRAKVRFCEGILRCAQPNDRSLILFPRYQRNVLTHSMNKASQRNLGGLVRYRGLFAPRRVIRPWTGGQAPARLPWSGACPRIRPGSPAASWCPGLSRSARSGPSRVVCRFLMRRSRLAPDAVFSRNCTSPPARARAWARTRTRPRARTRARRAARWTLPSSG